LAITIPSTTLPTVQAQGLPNPQRQFVDKGFVDISPATDAASRIYIKEVEKADNAALTEAEAKLNQWESDSLYGENGAYSKKQSNALNVTNEYTPQYSKVAEEIGAGLNERQKSRWKEVVARGQSNFSNKLNSHEFQQREAHYDTVSQTAIESAMNVAGMSAGKDQAEVERQRGFVMGLVEATAARKGIDPTEIKAKANSQFDMQQINSLLVQNPNDPTLAYGYWLKAMPSMTYDDQVKSSQTMTPIMQDYQAKSIANSMLGGGMNNATGTFNTTARPAMNYHEASAQAESGGRQFDDNGQTILGPVTKSGERAVGYSQIMPSSGPDAAKAAGLPWDEQRLYKDPAYNKALGDALRTQYFDKFGGDPFLGLAAYNWGPANVEKALKAGLPDPRKRAGGAKNYGQHVEGMKVQGNYDLNTLPLIGDEDNMLVNTMTLLKDGNTVVVAPLTDAKGNMLTTEQAMAQYKKTGSHMGKFDNQEAAAGYMTAVLTEQSEIAADPSYLQKFMGGLPEETRNYITKIGGMAPLPLPQKYGVQAGVQNMAKPQKGEADLWATTYTNARMQAEQFSPEMKKKVLAELKAKDDTMQMKFSQMYSEAMTYVAQDAPVPAELRTNLSGADQVKLDKAIKQRESGTKTVTDWAKWNKIQELSVTNPKAFKALNFERDIMPFVGGEQLSAASKMHAEAQGGDGNVALTAKEKAAAQTKTILKGANAAGIVTGDSKDAQKPENVKKLNAFTASMDVEISDFRDQHKREPTTVELQSMATKLSFEYRKKDAWFGGTAGYLLEKEARDEMQVVDGVDDIEQIIPTVRAQLRAAIKKQGYWVDEDGQQPFRGVVTDDMLISTFNNTKGVKYD
jgi:hypothetical protein